jgi:hypothetical protein
MRNKSKLLVTAFAVVLALTMGASAASANRSISLSETRATATSAALTFTEEGGGFNIICEVTLTVTLNRSIGKTRGNVVGGVTGVTVRNCRGGTVRVLAPEAARPWPIKYESFAGTLPNITSVRLTLERVGFLVEAFFGIARCLFGGNAQGTTGGNPITELRADERIAIPLVTNLGGAECPRNGIFRGTFRVTAPAAGIRMTLL